ncbi:3-hydroxyacyl-CoA dehydrogenase/enoyl-CoA hydratase family protein [Alicyclobacillus herbarius]|uniref:3-hydroxyacyl-CoA dehydrogenase/enoyl-CoA hydratase family protein n=1 Tax=Alicyclobacillus herbarius TaxID=122960 RepID=UPI000409D0E5|nr:3-hydroxyacyl-CoA dehydrogenase/enoyl-CoA hydratase family protein [Alicyclobacillus herbarius]
MKQPIRKAAVLGAGVMGAAIAAHLANVGLSVLLLDIRPNELTDAERAKGQTLDDRTVRNRVAWNGLQAALKAKPAAFYDPADAERIEIGNFDDDLTRLCDCDWVIEAVVEDLAIKKALLAQVAAVTTERTIVSTNTSGISIAAMSADCPASFRQRFLGTHFFNPPRYMRLLEIIPGPETNPELVEALIEFGQRVLGKGVVIAKDTPNFIANRIGTYGLIATLRAMEKYGLSVDEVDALTGPVMGRPKSATFRTLDLVGLDTMVHVARNVQQAVVDDDEKKAFALPPYIDDMVARGWLGEKTGQGFFRRMQTDKGREILALDLTTMEYRPRRKLVSPSLEAAKRAKDLGAKLRTLVSGEDNASRFIWEVLKSVLLYTARKHGEIADDIVAVDRAMKWGFSWELGPYETWDALGVRESVERMRREGESIPEFVEDMLASGQESFYRRQPGAQPRFYVGQGKYQDVAEPRERISLARLKEQGKVILHNTGASLIDIGEGVACLEFHSLKQAIGTDVVQMIQRSAQEVEKNWRALVIANEAPNFCVGANLFMMLMEAQDENWDDINLAVHQFQQALMRLKYLAKPVVAAPHQMALGGGAEVCLAAHRVQAAAETYIGLVEVGVGLIPGGGGNKEMLIRAIEAIPDGVEERLDSFVQKAFENIALAKVSTSAKQAKRMRILRDADGVTMQRDFLLHDAKQAAIALAEGGFRPLTPKRIPVIGEAGAARLKSGVYGMRMSGYISEHDEKIANHLIRVLTGGSVMRGAEVSEQYLLDLEREAFLSLIGEPKTQQRMQYMLTHGKPLRN